MFKFVSGAAIVLLSAAACGADTDPPPTETPEQDATQDTSDADAAGGTPRQVINICGTGGAIPTCPAYGLPVRLEVKDLQGTYPRLPDYRVSAYTGETVTFTLEGFEPNEMVQFFTTDETYDGLSYRTEDDGTLTLPVFIGSNDEAAEHHYVAVQDPEDSYARLAAFLIVILDKEAAAEAQRDVFREALSSIGYGD